MVPSCTKAGLAPGLFIRKNNGLLTLAGPLPRQYCPACQKEVQTKAPVRVPGPAEPNGTFRGSAGAIRPRLADPSRIAVSPTARAASNLANAPPEYCHWPLAFHSSRQIDPGLAPRPPADGHAANQSGHANRCRSTTRVAYRQSKADPAHPLTTWRAIAKTQIAAHLSAPDLTIGQAAAHRPINVHAKCLSALRISVKNKHLVVYRPVLPLL